MYIPRSMIGNVIRQAGYAPNATNFNDYVRYARGAMSAGQSPSPDGYRQYLGPQAQAQPPGGAKDQQTPPAPAQPTAQPYPVQLTQVPAATQTGMAPPPTVAGAPAKSPIRPQQYGAALSRMK